MPTTWDKILTYARRYPSPHNSQPIKLRVDGSSAELLYDLDRGLPAESYGAPFGSVCAGVFVEAVSIAAHALGCTVDERLDFTPMDFTDASAFTGSARSQSIPARARSRT